MIAIRTKSKKALKELVGTDISRLIIETSMLGTEYSDNVTKLPFVYPEPYVRKGFGQIDVVDGILTKVK